MEYIRVYYISSLLGFNSCKIILQTIALIGVREGVVQLGAVQKVIEDLSYVVLLRKKLSYIQSIPGVLLPHPSSSSSCWEYLHNCRVQEQWHVQRSFEPQAGLLHDQNLKLSPSMSSLEALLSKLPSVLPPVTTEPESLEWIGMEKVMKEDVEHDDWGVRAAASFTNNVTGFSWSLMMDFG